MNRPKICPHWSEVEGPAGFDEEYCKAHNNKCACCGERSECTWPEELAAEAEAKMEKDR